MATATAQMIVYQGSTTTLEAVQVPGDTYSWDLYNDPSVDFALTPGNCPPASARFTDGNTGPSVQVEWLQPGTYFFKVTAVDAAGCTNNLKVGMVIVSSPPLDAIVTGTVLCQQVTLDGSKSVGDIASYQWTLLDGKGIFTNPAGISTQFIVSPSYSGSLPADFRAKLEITGVNGAKDSEIYTFRVNPLPAAIISGTTIICQNGSGSALVTFTGNNGTAPYTFTYTADDGSLHTISTAANSNSVTIAVPLSTPGTFNYKLVSVVDATTCSQAQTGTAVITVTPQPVPTISGDTPTCVATTTHVYTTEPGMKNYVWTVSSGGTIISGGGINDNSISITWNNVGTESVSVSYQDQNGCSVTQPIIKEVTVNPLPDTSPIYHD
jgi:hypothetical protein